MECPGTYMFKWPQNPFNCLAAEEKKDVKVTFSKFSLPHLKHRVAKSEAFTLGPGNFTSCVPVVPSPAFIRRHVYPICAMAPCETMTLIVSVYRVPQMQGVGCADVLLYFKGPTTKQMRFPVNAYPTFIIAVRLWRRHLLESLQGRPFHLCFRISQAGFDVTSERDQFLRRETSQFLVGQLPDARVRVL